MKGSDLLKRWHTRNLPGQSQDFSLPSNIQGTQVNLVSWFRNGTLQFSTHTKTKQLLPSHPAPDGGTKGKDHGSG